MSEKWESICYDSASLNGKICTLPQVEAKVSPIISLKPEIHKIKPHHHKEKPICNDFFGEDDMGSAAPKGYIYPVRRNAKGGLEYTNVTNDPKIIGYVNEKKALLWVYGDVFIPMKEIQTDKLPEGSVIENLIPGDSNTSIIRTPRGENWIPGKELQFIDYKTLRKIIEHKMQEKKQKAQNQCKNHITELHLDMISDTMPA